MDTVCTGAPALPVSHLLGRPWGKAAGPGGLEGGDKRRGEKVDGGRVSRQDKTENGCALRAGSP